MSKKYLVKKHSGEQQPFSEDKLIESIRRAGAPEDIARQVLSQLRPALFDGITTREIYRRAFILLRKLMRSVAARYSLKSAIMEMGPSGYPFEKFVGEIFRKQGFETKTGQTIQGRCVQHEMDVVAEKNHLTIMVECKYRNDQSKISGVQVPLYVNSRMQDIEMVWKTKPENQGRKFQGWIVTNTRFSTDAEEYGTCAGLNMISWGFPEKGNLRELVERYAIFPVTALTGLSKKQKQDLLAQNIILVDHLIEKPYTMVKFGLSEKKQQEILMEASMLSSVGNIL
jgi:Holliday junction resolvase-like predicted endonuclease